MEGNENMQQKTMFVSIFLKDWFFFFGKYEYIHIACSSFSILRLWRPAEGAQEAAVRAHLPTIFVGRIQKVGRGQLMSSSHSLVFLLKQ